MLYFNVCNICKFIFCIFVLKKIKKKGKILKKKKKILNSFHPNIEFIYKTKVNSKLASFEILLLRKGQNIISTVYAKVTNSDI